MKLGGLKTVMLYSLISAFLITLSTWFFSKILSYYVKDVYIPLQVISLIIIFFLSFLMFTKLGGQKNWQPLLINAFAFSGITSMLIFAVNKILFLYLGIEYPILRVLENVFWNFIPILFTSTIAGKTALKFRHD